MNAFAFWGSSVVATAASLFFSASRRTLVPLGIGGATAALLALLTAPYIPDPVTAGGGHWWQEFALAATLFFGQGLFMFAWMPRRPLWRAFAVVAWAASTSIQEWLIALALGEHWSLAEALQTLMNGILIYAVLIAVYETLDIRRRLYPKQRRGIWSWSWPLFALASGLIGQAARVWARDPRG